MIQVFHRAWFGPRDMPQRYIDYGQTWLDHHPGWILVDWTYGDEPGTLKPLRTSTDGHGWLLNRIPTSLHLENADMFQEVGETRVIRHGAGKANSAQAVQRADIAGYDIVYQLGGVYLNCDIECQKPLDGLADHDAWATWEIDDLYVSNAVLGAKEPHHPFWQACVEVLPDRIRTQPHKAMNWQTGPHLISHVNREMPDVLTVHESNLFHPYLWDYVPKEDDEWPDAVAIHHWGHKVADDLLWTPDEPPEADFPEFTQPTVVIGYIHDGSIRGEFGLCIAATLQYSFDLIERVWAGYSGPRISNGRNKLVYDFLNHTSSEWLMMVDSDMIFKSTAIEDLVAVADRETRPIVGGLCFARRAGELYPTMYRMSEEQNTFLVASNVAYESLVDVDATGAAFLLVHRDVLVAMYESFPPPYRWFQETQIGTGADAMEVGEDITFCLRARSLGYPIFVHTGVMTGHMKDTMLTAEMYEAQQRKESPV